MNVDYNKGIAEAVRSCFESMEFKYRFNEEKGVFDYVVTNNKPGIAYLHHVILIHDDSFTVLAFCPVIPNPEDPDMMSRVGEYLHRVNHGMKHGRFEFDYDSGEIRFAYLTECREELLDGTMLVEYALFLPGALFERYGKDLMEVMFAGAAPKAALEAAESDAEEVFRDMLESFHLSSERFQELLDRATEAGVAIEEDETGETSLESLSEIPF